MPTKATRKGVLFHGKKDKYNIAIVGATGAVGHEMIEILEERGFPVETLSLYASERSEGKALALRART